MAAKSYHDYPAGVPLTTSGTGSNEPESADQYFVLVNGGAMFDFDNGVVAFTHKLDAIQTLLSELDEDQVSDGVTISDKFRGTVQAIDPAAQSSLDLDGATQKLQYTIVIDRTGEIKKFISPPAQVTLL